MSDWSEGLEHAAITPENRDAFNIAASKFDSQVDMCVGYMEQSKLVGQPFKLPESMDKLPDDAVRGDMTKQMNKLLGREFAADVEGLADLNLKDGSAEGIQTDEAMAANFKQFIVDQKISKSVAQKILGFHNRAMTAGRATLAEQQKVADAQAIVKVETEKTACAEALAAHKDFGSKEKVAEADVLMHRAILNKTGHTPEQAAEVAEIVKDSAAFRNPLIRRIILKSLAPLAAESSHKGFGGGDQPDAPIDPEAGSPTYKALGWS